LKEWLESGRKGGLYSPPGIPPGIWLQSQNSTGLIMEFDIPAESARNIMGIVFLLLCLVIPYRVRPNSMKKKLKSVERLVDFHGTSPRSSHEVIHVMISRARTKQTLFVWHHAHQTWPTLFFPPPPSHHHQPCSSLPPTTPFTTTDLRDCPQMPTTTNDHTATTTACKTKPTTHKRRWLPPYKPQLVNNGQQPRTDMGNNEPR